MTSEPTTNGTASVDQQETSKRIVGRHAALTLAGPHMTENLMNLELINPSLGRSVLENGFGSMAVAASSGFREWALMTISVLTAIGDCADQVEVYLEAALKHGATEAEILGVVNHASSFIGVPRAVNSMRRIAPRLMTARGCALPREYLVGLSDHETLIRDSGSGDIPIVFVHALSMDGRMFQQLIPTLAKAGRVITYDLRGHGHARGAPLTESLDHLVNDLVLLLDSLKIEKADVYGASYGGAVAQYFTLAHPTRVRSLCVMATAARGHPLLATRATAAEQYGMGALMAESIIRWFTPETIAKNTWAVRYARAMLEAARVEDWAAAWRAMARLDCIDRIPEIEAPILVLAGTQDLSSTPELMKPIHEAARNSSYVELSPGTHMMAMEQPEAVSAALIKFREQVGESAV